VSKVKDGMLETEVDWRSLDLNEATAVDVYFHTQDYNGEEDFSDYVISNSKGVLAVTQRSVAVDVVDSSDPTLLDITIHAIDGDIIVKNITIMAVGTANVHSATLISTGVSTSSNFVNGRAKFLLNELEIADGETKILLVSVNVVNALSESTIGLKIAHPHDIELKEGTVSLKTTAPFSGYTDLAYVRSIPSIVTIDGAFADWIGKDVKTDTIGDVSNENIDIKRYGTSSSTSDISFYLKVNGKMVGGTAVPFRNTAKAISDQLVDSDRDTVPDIYDVQYQYDFNNDGTPDVETNHDVDGDGIQDHPYDGDYWLNTTIPSNFRPEYRNKFVSIYIGPVEKPEVTGEDTVFIFIDKDNSTNTGCHVDNIGADKLIQIEGKYGEITKKNVYTYNAQTAKWEIDAGIVYAQCDSIQLEVGINAANLGITGDFSVYFETSDWTGDEDHSDVDMTRGFAPISRGAPATTPPSWPTSWISFATDEDDGFTDASLEILELYYSDTPQYLYIRTRTESNAAPILTDNSWWLYIDLTGDGTNDWLIEEKSDYIWNYQWNATNNNWGTDSDFAETLTDADIGGAVRVTMMTIDATAYGCIDFAIEKGNFASMDGPSITAACSANEDETLSGDADVALSDCTSSNSVLHTPEFSDLVVPIIGIVVIFIVTKQRRRKKGSKGK
jgi:hypothetical protein